MSFVGMGRALPLGTWTVTDSTQNMSAATFLNSRKSMMEAHAGGTGRASGSAHPVG